MIGELFVCRFLVGRQDIEQRAVLVFTDRLVERELPVAEALIHFDHVALTDVQTIRE